MRFMKVLFVLAGAGLLTACSGGKFALPDFFTRDATHQVSVPKNETSTTPASFQKSDEKREAGTPNSPADSTSLKKSGERREASAPPLPADSPASPSREDSQTKQRENLGLVEVGPGQFCPVSAVVRKRPAIWSRAGAHPFAGTPQSAIVSFSSAIPAEVKENWWRALRGGLSQKGVLKEGDVFCEMKYSKPRAVGGLQHYTMKHGVVGGWVKGGSALNKADFYDVVYRGNTWRLKRPEVCDNWHYVVLSKTEEPKGKEEGKAKLPPPPPPPRTYGQPTGENPFTLRVRFWEWNSLPLALKQRVNMVNAGESNESYAIEDGAVSRDLDGELMASWRKGEATTVTSPVTIRVDYPGSNGLEEVVARPGEHTEHPKLVYWERNIPRTDAARLDSQFRAFVKRVPEGCKVKYPRRRGGSYWLDTRLNAEGRPSELAQAAQRKNVGGMNLNVILDCEEN